MHTNFQGYIISGDTIFNYSLFLIHCFYLVDYLTQINTIFEDENFCRQQATTKYVKVTSLKTMQTVSEDDLYYELSNLHVRWLAPVNCDDTTCHIRETTNQIFDNQLMPTIAALHMCMN